MRSSVNAVFMLRLLLAVYFSQVKNALLWLLSPLFFAFLFCVVLSSSWRKNCRCSGTFKCKCIGVSVYVCVRAIDAKINIEIASLFICFLLSRLELLFSGIRRFLLCAYSLYLYTFWLLPLRSIVNSLATKTNSFILYANTKFRLALSFHSLTVTQNANAQIHTHTRKTNNWKWTIGEEWTDMNQF